MLKKYNIALTPTSRNQEIVKYSDFFSSISDQYQLGENSLPHVTLCQFYIDENDILSLWNKTCNVLTKHIVSLELQHFNCISFDNNIFWLSLIPNQKNLLNDMNSSIVEIVNSPNKRTYDPHLTLINTKNSEYKKIADQFLKKYSPISDNFALSIGECDEIGQFTKLLFKKT